MAIEREGGDVSGHGRAWLRMLGVAALGVAAACGPGAFEGTGDTPAPPAGVVEHGNTATQQLASERAALIALYHATDGPNWDRQDNWLSEAPIDEWHGVTTDANGRAIRLALPANKLSGTLPADLVDLGNLQEIVLSSNALRGKIPAEFGQLTQLQKLKLRTNQLTGEIPAELGQLGNLQVLDLYSNRLRGEIPAELGRLINLQVLHLAYNQLRGEIPAELGQLHNLQEWSFVANSLDGCSIPASLRSVPMKYTQTIQFTRYCPEVWQSWIE